MHGLSDTSPEAMRVLIACYRAMPPERKWRQLGDAYRTGRLLHATGFRERQPGATAADVTRDWLSQTVGRGAWPKGGTMLGQPLEQQEVIRAVLAAFEAAGVACAIGGSVASSVYGVTRFTNDVDLTAEPFDAERDALLAQFGPDYYVSADAVSDALRLRDSFNIIHFPSGFKIDVFVQKVRAFDGNLLARRRMRADLDPSGRPVPLLSPEDVLLLKLEWYRLGGEVSDRQWNDVLGMLRVQAGQLDDAYLDHWADELQLGDLLERVRQEAVIDE